MQLHFSIEPVILISKCKKGPCNDGWGRDQLQHNSMKLIDFILLFKYQRVITMKISYHISTIILQISINMRAKVLLVGAVLSSIVHSLPYIGLQKREAGERIPSGSPPFVPTGYLSERRTKIGAY